MDSYIDLNDAQVVNVTGTARRDKRHYQKKRECSCHPSLRATTIIIFVCIGAVYTFGVIASLETLRLTLRDRDKEACSNSIDRFTMIFHDDSLSLYQLDRRAAWSKNAAEAAKDPTNQTALKTFVEGALNQTAVYYDNNTVKEYVYTYSTLVNYWAILDPRSFKTLYSQFHPAKDGELASEANAFPQPEFPPEFFKSIIGDGSDWKNGWLSFYSPKVVSDPMAIAIEAIMMPNDYGRIEDETIYGYLVAGRTAKPRMQMFADDIPGCISMKSNDDDLKHFDKTDMEMWDKVVPGTFTAKKTYGGVPVFVQREKGYLSKCEIRACPQVPLFNATENLMTGYFKLCNQVNDSCMFLRVDRPMSMVEQGSVPFIWVAVEIVIVVILLCVIFVIFLDCAVLRRIAKLSEVIRKQTRGHRQAQMNSDEDSTTTTSTQSSDEKNQETSRGKKGKSARGSGDRSRTTSSDGGAPNRTNTRDEIKHLKHTLEQNAISLRKRLEAINESLKREQQKSVRHRQAMHLLSLWCGRKDRFPGLRPNAMQLRYEPTRDLDDLMSNPIAVEYLKSHCDHESTLENLWFLLDVSWLKELETAEDHEKEPGKREQIHNVAAASAMNIMLRYITANAPQQISLSAGTFKALREKSNVYERGMFETAVSEVKLTMNTDILPRFQKSASYPAMSETLFMDNSGAVDDSELSDATVSTAGSILTDENSEADDGVALVLASTFKNLHTTMDAGSGGQTESSKPNSSSHSREPSVGGDRKRKSKQEGKDSESRSFLSDSSAMSDESD